MRQNYRVYLSNNKLENNDFLNKVQNHFDMRLKNEFQDYSFAVSNDNKVLMNYSDSNLFFSINDSEEFYLKVFKERMQIFLEENSEYFDWYAIDSNEHKSMS